MKLLTLGLIAATIIGSVSTAALPVLFALANAPSLFFDGNRTDGVVFSDETGLKLDIYTPERTVDERFPVVVFFYGGSWQWGERSDYPFVGMTLADEGFVTVIPDYRKYPEVKFPAFVEDGAEAVKWVRDHIASYGGDPEQIHVMGHSAGAHIASLLAVDDRYLAAVDSTGAIDGFVGLAGPYRFTPDYGAFLQIFGPEENFPLMQTTTFVDGGEPPMLLLHGLDHGTVYDQHTRELAEAVQAKSGCVATRLYPDVGHAGVMSGFTWVYRDSKPMVADVVGWLRNPAGC